MHFSKQTLTKLFHRYSKKAKAGDQMYQDIEYYFQPLRSRMKFEYIHLLLPCNFSKQGQVTSSRRKVNHALVSIVPHLKNVRTYFGKRGLISKELSESVEKEMCEIYEELLEVCGSTTASKFLHFVQPNIFPIKDGKVTGSRLKKNRSKRINTGSPRQFIEFIKAVRKDWVENKHVLDSCFGDRNLNPNKNGILRLLDKAYFAK